VIAFLARRTCRSHRAALVDFADHRAAGPAVQRALDHLQRCRPCEQELAATTLVLHALRRLHEETRRAEPAPDGWTRLRDRLVATRREPSLWMTCLPGVALAFGLVILVGGPTMMRGAQPILDDGPALVGRTGFSDASRFEPVTTPAHSRAFAPVAWRLQDLPPPSSPLSQPRAMDTASADGVDPADAVSIRLPEEQAPVEAHVTWR
jgi:hypothetical protein